MSGPSSRGAPRPSTRAFGGRQGTSRRPSPPLRATRLAAADAPVPHLSPCTRGPQVAVPQMSACGPGLRGAGVVPLVGNAVRFDADGVGLKVGRGRGARCAGSGIGHGVTALGVGHWARTAPAAGLSTYHRGGGPGQEHPPTGAFSALLSGEQAAAIRTPVAVIAARRYRGRPVDLRHLLARWRMIRLGPVRTVAGDRGAGHLPRAPTVAGYRGSASS
jgi:hypothetical protein